MTEPNNTENLAADAADIAAAQAATEEFTNTIADAVAVEVEEETVVPAPAELDQPIQTVGRRKRAIVRVRMTAGTGQIICNGRSLEDYFPNKLHQQLIKSPLVLI